MKETKTHPSYGMIQISKFSGNKSQFFGSDLYHGGGVSISIKKADVTRDLSKEWYYGSEEVIRVEMSHSQFVDAITSGMNTQGVPCTIKRLPDQVVPQIDHVIDKRDQFNYDMMETQMEHLNKIDEILKKLSDDKIGKRKKDEIVHDIKVLKDHLMSNTDFVMKSFNKSMENTVSEAKHSIAQYIDHKVHTMGLEAMRNELQISMSDDEKPKEIKE